MRQVPCWHIIKHKRGHFFSKLCSLPDWLHITARRDVLLSMRCQCCHKHIIWLRCILCGWHGISWCHLLGIRWVSTNQQEAHDGRLHRSVGGTLLRRLCACLHRQHHLLGK